MQARMSKEVTDRTRACLFVLSAFVKQGASVAEKLLDFINPYLGEGTEAPSFPVLFTSFAAVLRAVLSGDVPPTSPGTLEKVRPQTGDYPHTVATTWSMSFEEVAKASEASADLLRVLAFLAPDAIPLEIFDEGAAELGPALAEALAGEDVAEVWVPLLRYSLVEREVEDRTISVHRMVQAVVRDGLGEEGKTSPQDGDPPSAAEAGDQPTSLPSSNATPSPTKALLLHASSASEPICVRLGFRRLCPFDFYEYRAP